MVVIYICKEKEKERWCSTHGGANGWMPDDHAIRKWMRKEKRMTRSSSLGWLDGRKVNMTKGNFVIQIKFESVNLAMLSITLLVGGSHCNYSKLVKMNVFFLFLKGGKYNLL